MPSGRNRHKALKVLFLYGALIEITTHAPGFFFPFHLSFCCFLIIVLAIIYFYYEYFLADVTAMTMRPPTTLSLPVNNTEGNFM